MKSLATAGLALLFGLTACGQESTTPSASADAFALPADNVMFGVKHFMLSNGVVTGELMTDTVYSYNDERPMDLRGVNVTFYNERGVQTGNLTSSEGQYDLPNATFVARGNVVLIAEGSAGHRQLETQELHYDIRGDQLWTDQPFTLVESGRTTSGNSFRSDSKFQTWQVTGAQTQGTVSGDGAIRF